MGVLPSAHSGAAIADWVVQIIQPYEELEGVDHAFSISPKAVIKLAVID